MALTFRIVCPYCSEPTRAPAEAFYRWWPAEDDPLRIALTDPSADAAVASYCPECEGLLSLVVRGRDAVLRPIMAEDVPATEWGHYQADISLVDCFPQKAGTSFSDAVPLTIRLAMPDLLEDASRRRNAAACLTTCGGVLEVALKALEESAGLEVKAKDSLVVRIDRLREASVITGPVAEWAHEIRLDRNASAHELIGDPDLARAYADFLKLFIEVGFELPNKIRAIKMHKEQRRDPKAGRPSA